MEKKATGKISLEEFFYFGFFILLSVTKGLGFYDGQKLFLLLVIPAFLCVLCKILITPYTRRQWIIVTLLLLLTGFVYFQSGEKGILFTMFMVLGMKNISIHKLMRTGLVVWSLCSVVLSVFSFFRLEHTIYRVHQKMGLGHIFRWSLGFTHPNILHITYFILCVFIVYELADHYGFKHFLLLSIGNALVFFYSVSFTGFGIVMILLAAGLYVRFRPRFCLWEKAVVNLALPLFIMVSFVLPLIMAAQYAKQQVSPLMHSLDQLFNTRIVLASHFLLPEFITPFGARIASLGLPSGSLDSSYIWTFINYGFVPFFLLMAAYLILVADYSRKQKTREVVIIVCFLMAGFTEQLLFNTSFKNISLFFLGELLFRQKEGEKEYGLFPGLRREVGLPALRFMPELKKHLTGLGKSGRKQILSGILAGAVFGMILCGVFYRAPKGYVVQRFYTDGLFETSVYPASAEDPAYEGYRIMNYVDADTPMQIVEGKAVALETARYYTGSALIGGLCGFGLYTGYLCLRARKKEMERL